MLKLVLLVHTLGVASTLGDTLDYAQDANRYNVHPYYQHQNQENPSTMDSLHHQQQALDSPTLDERFGGFMPPPFHGGHFGVGFGGPPAPPPPAPGAYEGSPGAGGYGNGPPGPITPPPFGFPDPGFQTQTGFEGLLVPNTWYGLLPWGIEGVIIVIAGIIVFAIIIIAIIGLIAWLLGVKAAFPFVKTEETATATSRSSPRDPWGPSLMNLSASVIDAIEKLNEVLTDSDDENLKKVL